ncbi:hypothetical protein O3P69_003922 [Scylla paramamosain]|uniref:Uncharacterized protein n=1 Tax=Scylla paramamosain TaxID=85552 RepID=A0AAW0UGE0_SCYPA
MSRLQRLPKLTGVHSSGVNGFVVLQRAVDRVFRVIHITLKRWCPCSEEVLKVLMVVIIQRMVLTCREH